MGIINKKIRCKILRVVLEEYTLHILCNIINNLINSTILNKLIEILKKINKKIDRAGFLVTIRS